MNNVPQRSNPQGLTQQTARAAADIFGDFGSAPQNPPLVSTESPLSNHIRDAVLTDPSLCRNFAIIVASTAAQEFENDPQISSAFTNFSRSTGSLSDFKVLKTSVSKSASTGLPWKVGGAFDKVKKYLGIIGECCAIAVGAVVGTVSGVVIGVGVWICMLYEIVIIMLLLAGVGSIVTFFVVRCFLLANLITKRNDPYYLEKGIYQAHEDLIKKLSLIPSINPQDIDFFKAMTLLAPLTFGIFGGILGGDYVSNAIKRFTNKDINIIDATNAVKSVLSQQMPQIDIQQERMNLQDDDNMNLIINQLILLDQNKKHDDVLSFLTYVQQNQENINMLCKLKHAFGAYPNYNQVFANVQCGGRMNKKLLQSYTVKTLIQLCKANRLTYSGCKKQALIDKLSKAMSKKH